MEVDLATGEGIEIVSWHNVRKVLNISDFVIVTSVSRRGTMGWIERIENETAYLLEYNEKGNISSEYMKVSFILIPADIY